jgi:hypothetical protein
LSALKSYLHAQCLAYIEQRIDTANKAIEEAQSAANDETKSSAGDKYETGRAMMQLEIEKNSVQLNESLKQKRALQEINPGITSDTIQRGSIVFTDQNNFYIAIGAGQFEFENKVYVTISQASPIGAKMIGLKKADKFVLNTRTYLIENVL